MSGRPWTTSELAILRRHYGRESAAAIAERIGRTTQSIYVNAVNLGLARGNRRFTPRDRTRIERLAAAGYCNRCIAGRVKSHRERIRHQRRRWGLPELATRGAVRSCPSCRRRLKAALREQLAAWGVASLGGLRAEAYRRYAAASGWPEDLRPRAIQILDALWERGPQTRRQLAEAVGMPWKGSRNSLVSNDPEGSYLAHLQARGLVTRLGRIVRGQGRGHSVNLYSIAAGVVRGERPGYESKRAKRERKTHERELEAAGAAPG